MNPIVTAISIILVSFLLPVTAPAGELEDLLGRVEALNVNRGDYGLGKTLTDTQKQTARRNAVGNPAPGTYKFKDRDLFVVAEKSTDRVVIIYEQYDAAPVSDVQKLVGSLFMDFDEPTLFVHDKVIYWAFDKNGKIPEKTYADAKKTKRRLEILATVKLNSSLKITEKKDQTGTGNVYYIISSEPVLKLIQSK